MILKDDTVENLDGILNTYVGLRRAMNKIAVAVREDVSCYGLNVSEFGVLELLYHRGPQQTQAIKEKILIANSSTTYTIDQLIKKGYVSRSTNHQDARIKEVSLTEDGQKMMEEIFPQHAKMLASHFAALTQEEIGQFHHLLKKLSGYQS